MNGPRGPVSGSYARRVEGSWSRLCGRAAILSERDWALLESWYRRGIPLQIVQEAIDEAVARRARGRSAARPPRGLSYIAPAVEEAWRAVLEGRSAEREAAHSVDRALPAGAAAWRRRRDEESEKTALGRLLAVLIKELEAGDPAERVEARLDREIAAVVPDELRHRAEREVERDLAAYVARLQPATLEDTRRRAVTRRLREWLGLANLR
jgi:hypothetical protein